MRICRGAINDWLRIYLYCYNFNYCLNFSMGSIKGYVRLMEQEYLDKLKKDVENSFEYFSTKDLEQMLEKLENELYSRQDQSVEFLGRWLDIYSWFSC